MKQEPYYFEIKDMMAQFITAFDDIVIKRYNVNRKAEDKLAVRILYSPKQRVLYDIINTAQNMTLPAVAVNIASISRDNSRVFNKLDSANYTQGSNAQSGRYKAPVPINISVNMSIITRYQTDMDQILSNFIPYSNPYVIIAWKVPEAFDLPSPQEIRCEVLWDGNVSINYPVELNGQQKPRVVADTTFTIKGWVFKEVTGPYDNIYYVDYSLNPESNITSFEELTGVD